MKIINLIKCEFIKNYTLKKIISVFIILLLSVIVVSEFQEFYYVNDNPVQNELNAYKENYENILEYPSSEEQYQSYQTAILSYAISAYEKLLLLDDYENLEYNSWQIVITREKINSEKQLYFIDKYLNKEDISLTLVQDDEVYLYVEELSKLNSNDLLKTKEELTKLINQYDLLLEENKFYKYVDFEINRYKQGFSSSFWILADSTIDIVQTIVDKKIEDERNYYVLNIYNLYDVASTEYDSEYAKNISKQEILKRKEILKYSIEKGIKQDLTSNGIVDINREYIYLYSKNIVNQIFNLSIIVMFLVVIMSGDIVSGEHSLGTEKLILTSPNKRWKILLSKFIYMILNMYMIWFLALLLISLYAGIKYGFSDLLTPKLIYLNGSVVEVNYYLYIILKILYISIPIIALISVILMLSTLTLNTAITVGSMMAITVISPFLWHFIQQFKLTLLAYTPIPYFMFSQIINLNENYLKTTEFANISEGYGILISLITIIVCYLITHIIYTRRDVKN